jgi:AbrB family looped-hinge helix DNA binding protein
MIEAKLSSKNQIVVPREARKALKVKAGDNLLVVVRGDMLLITRKPRSFAKQIQGVAGDCAHPIILSKRERAGSDD